MDLDPSNNPRCLSCETLSIDYAYFKHYQIAVCKECIQKEPGKYSLLTKTECRQDYLLTESNFFLFLEM